MVYVDCASKTFMTSEYIMIGKEYQPQFKNRHTKNIIETKRLFDAEGKLCIRWLFPFRHRKDAMTRFLRGQGIHIITQVREKNIKRHIKSAVMTSVFSAMKQYGKTNVPYEAEDYSLMYYYGKVEGKKMNEYKTLSYNKKRYNVHKRYNSKTGKYRIVSKERWNRPKDTMSVIERERSNYGIYSASGFKKAKF